MSVLRNPEALCPHAHAAAIAARTRIKDSAAAMRTRFATHARVVHRLADSIERTTTACTHVQQPAARLCPTAHSPTVPDRARAMIFDDVPRVEPAAPRSWPTDRWLPVEIWTRILEYVAYTNMKMAHVTPRKHTDTPSIIPADCAQPLMFLEPAARLRTLFIALCPRSAGAPEQCPEALASGAPGVDVLALSRDTRPPFSFSTCAPLTRLIGITRYGATRVHLAQNSNTSKLSELDHGLMLLAVALRSEHCTHCVSGQSPTLIKARKTPRFVLRDAWTGFVVDARCCQCLVRAARIIAQTRDLEIGAESALELGSTGQSRSGLCHHHRPEEGEPSGEEAQPPPPTQTGVTCGLCASQLLTMRGRHARDERDNPHSPAYRGNSTRPFTTTDAPWQLVSLSRSRVTARVQRYYQDQDPLEPPVVYRIGCAIYYARHAVLRAHSACTTVDEERGVRKRAADAQAARGRIAKRARQMLKYP